MVTKNEIKLITSLRQKKYRKTHQLFVAEGVKLVEEFYNSSFKPKTIYALDTYSGAIPSDKIRFISENDLEKLTNLHSPSTILGVFHIPLNQEIRTKGIQLVLDEIKDPGNLGTIIRLADWFGVTHIICSEDTVDCFNSKVVQATMGSLARVSIQYTDIEKYIEQSDLPVYTTALKGNNIYQTELPNEALVVMGNEANGVRKSILESDTIKLTIPRINQTSNIESLNVAMATGLILSEFTR